jgi:hypothetical protein
VEVCQVCTVLKPRQTLDSCRPTQYQALSTRQAQRR